MSLGRAFNGHLADHHQFLFAPMSCASSRRLPSAPNSEMTSRVGLSRRRAAADPGGRVELRAKNPGSWGYRLRAELTVTTSPLPLDSVRPTLSQLWLQSASRLEVGSVIRVRLDDGGQVITSPVDRTERHLDVALDPRHSRWMAWLLATESQLVEPVSEWADQPILFNDALETATTEPFGLGQDCYADVIFDDVVGDDFVDEPPYSGVQALAEVTQLGMFHRARSLLPGPADRPQRQEPTNNRGRKRGVGTSLRLCGNCCCSHLESDKDQG